MLNKEELRRDYQRNISELEEQENIIKRAILEGQDYTQDIMFQVRQLIDKRATSSDPFMQAKKELEQNEAHYVEKLKRERQLLISEKNKLEEKYVKQLKELDD